MSETRREQTIDERPEPSLVFVRGSIPELVVVEKGLTLSWPIPHNSIASIIADLADWKRKRP